MPESTNLSGSKAPGDVQQPNSTIPPKKKGRGPLSKIAMFVVVTLVVAFGLMLLILGACSLFY